MEYSIFQFPFSWLTASFFAMPRLLAVFSIFPLFARQAIPGLLRIGVAFSFAIFLIPSIEYDAASVIRSGTGMLVVALKEAIIGLLLGFIISLPIWAMETLGAYIDNQRGAGIASSINPLTGHDSSPLGELFSQATIVFLIISGGVFTILSVIYESYIFWPVFKILPDFSDRTPMILLRLTDQMVLLAILLSAPVIFSMFLAEFGLGLVSRFVPQLQVFFLAMPVKSAIAFFVLSVYASNLFAQLSDQVSVWNSNALKLIKLIFPG